MCIAKDTDGNTTLALDCEYVGRTTNNDDEYGGFILGIHRARSVGITDISIRGDSKLVIDQISARARCKTRSLSLLLERALFLLQPASFPHGIDAQWIRRTHNTEADDAANLGLRNRSQSRNWLFYDA